jgi:acetylornithine deacetylase/succinyl-diaminopimelate desuccinylase-like protein
MRLVAGQEVERAVEVFERLLRDAAPEGAELDVELLANGPAGLVPPESPAVQLGLEAFEHALGVRPLLVRSGGSLPIVAALAAKGTPTIITGFDLPEGNIHSPNERLLVEHFPLGVEAARQLYLNFGRLR